MDLNSILEQVQAKAANVGPLGKSLKFDFGNGQFLHIDGSGSSNLISMEDKDADCTVHVTTDNLIKLVKGELNPMTAMMMGKVKIKGDPSVAMKLQSLLG